MVAGWNSFFGATLALNIAVASAMTLPEHPRSSLSIQEDSQHVLNGYSEVGNNNNFGDARSSELEGKFVTNLTMCPTLPPRKERPKNVHDLRPDDFSVVMALGDSITAGAFAEGIQDDILSSWAEWRGQSYAGGSNPGAITVPNLLKHYNSSIKGGALGKNLVPEVCIGPLSSLCSPTGWNSEVDRFNAARTGAYARHLLHEARDYLVPQLKKHNIEDDAFKYMSFQIGSNDLCQLCLADEGTIYNGPGSPQAFENDILETLEYIRNNIPNTVVNLVGVFRVSEIWNLTRHEGSYCQQGIALPPIPHYNLECSCTLQEGKLGEWYRARMDALRDKYNEKLLRIVKAYQHLNDPSFAVLWQPANIPLAKFPIEAVSNVDCFHPSTANHERIAASVWNRLTLNAKQRETEFGWTKDVLMRCLEEDDRLQTTAIID